MIRVQRFNVWNTRLIKNLWIEGVCENSQAVRNFIYLVFDGQWIGQVQLYFSTTIHWIYVKFRITTELGPNWNFALVICREQQLLVN